MRAKPTAPIVTVDDYIAQQPQAVQAGLTKLRQIVQKVAPDATEVISYGMPAYKLHGMLLYFAVAKNHYGFYAMPGAIAAFKDRLEGYELSKGTIRFPLNKPIPVKLVTDIVRFRVQENLQKMEAKSEQKKK